MSPAVIAQFQYNRDAVKKAKTEIKAKDPQRFARLEKRDNDGLMTKFAWNHELKEMNDSLKLDSLYKKAYFEGAQMVRDSLAKAQTKNN